MRIKTFHFGDFTNTMWFERYTCVKKKKKKTFHLGDFTFFFTFHALLFVDIMCKARLLTNRKIS